MPTMNCTRFEHLLDEASDARRPVDAPGWLDHAADCPHCRSVWQRRLLLEQAVEEWHAGTPRVDLADSILARLDREAPLPTGAASFPGCSGQGVGCENFRIGSHGRHGKWEAAVAAILKFSHPTAAYARGGAAVIVAVAAVLVLMMKPLLFPPHAGPETPPPVAQTLEEGDGMASAGPMNVPPTADQPADPELLALAQEVGSVWRALRQEAAAAMRDSAVLVPPVDLLLAGHFPQDDGPSEPPAEPWDDHWEPLRERLSGAFDFLLDELPNL